MTWALLIIALVLIYLWLMAQLDLCRLTRRVAEIEDALDLRARPQ